MSWSTQYTQTNSQFYRVATENEFPYNVYGNSQLERLEDESGMFYKPSIHPLDESYEGYDIQSFRKGCITVSPLTLDRTAYDSLDALNQRSFIKTWSGGEN